MQIRGTRKWAVVFSLSAGLFALACGGSDDGDDGDSGDGDGAGGAPANVECVPAAGVSDAVCVNETDCPSVESGSLREKAAECLVDNCLGSDDQTKCTADCLVEELSTTNGCSTCYGESAACGAEFCLSECLANANAPDCVECRIENGCIPGFFECSGIAQ